MEAKIEEAEEVEELQRGFRSASRRLKGRGSLQGGVEVLVDQRLQEPLVEVVLQVVVEAGAAPSHCRMGHRPEAPTRI